MLHLPRHSGERGSVILLGLGILGVCLVAIAVVVDATSAFAQRRQLYSLADAAALSGVQSIDLASYYATGAGAGTRLDAASVQQRVEESLAAAEAGAGVAGVRLDGVHTDGVSVRVDLSAPLRLPFLPWLGAGAARASSTARLDYRPVLQGAG